MMSQTASLFQYYQKWVFEEGKLSEHSENSQNTLIKASSWFFVTLGKTFINILVVKQSACNAKISNWS